MGAAGYAEEWDEQIRTYCSIIIAAMVVDVVQYGLEISKHVVMFNSYSADPSVCMVQTSTQPEAHSFCGRVFISVIPMSHS